MATSSDSKVIDRESTRIGLVDRYKSQRVGGSFDAKKDVKTDGSNESAVASSISDTTYTKTKGFKIKMKQGVSEFREVDGNQSKQLSSRLKGFNNKKYISSNFSR